MLAALHWPNGDAEPILIAPDEGMNTAVAQASKLNKKGHPILIIEVRDTGETKTNNWRFFGADYYIAYMLRKNWLSMWAEDILVCARWLEEKQKTKTVRLIADGQIVPAAQHAAALESELISKLEMGNNALKSWRDLMTNKDAYPHLHNAVHNALRFYDLPDLEKLRD